MTAEPVAPAAQDAPLLSQSVANIFAGMGLLATLGLGWTLARATAGLPPFQGPGSGATTAAQAQPQTLMVTASDLKFDVKELKVDGPGKVTVHLENQGLIDHDFSIEGVKGRAYSLPKKSVENTFDLSKPGTYTFYCSLPGHREAGMTGKIIVGDGKAGATGAKTDSKAPAAPTADAHASHAATVPAQSQGNQVLQPVMDGDTKVFTLAAQVVNWEVLPGVREEAWTYNGQLPGPMIRVTEGDRVRVTLKNELGEPTVLHIHGPRLPNTQDGVPDVTQPTIPVGGSFSYEFTATPSGTYVYHSHHNTAVQEPKGLYGVIIIDPKPGSAEAQRDAQYQRDFVQVISEFGGYFMVNGHSFPATDVLEAKVGEKVRIRLINLGQTAHPMHLHGYHFKVVGTDGYPVKGEPLEKDTINVAPGERYDLEFVADNPGVWVFHCHILSHVTNQGVEPGGMITVLKVV